MHDQLHQDVRRAIEAMSDAEKLEFIEELARSLRSPKHAECEKLTPAGKKRLIESVRGISSRPMEGPGGFSGRDHDQILYGPFARTDDPDA